MKILMIVLGVLVILNVIILATIMFKVISCKKVDSGIKKRRVSDRGVDSDQEMVARKALDSIPEYRIAGGSKSSIENVPFIAAVVVKKHNMLFNDMLQCSCVIISSHCALTAAHCIFLLEEQGFTKKEVVIRSNHQEWRKGKTHEILQWISHEKYDEELRDNDLGLVKIKQPFNEKNEKPINLASKTYLYKSDVKIIVAGWGWKVDASKEVASHLNKVDLKIIDQKYCDELYCLEGYPLDENVFCGGDLRANKGACAFDLGGPAIDKNVLIGIVSWGIGCGQTYFPSVFTRISVHSDWIMKNRKQLKC